MTRSLNARIGARRRIFAARRPGLRGARAGGGLAIVLTSALALVVSGCHVVAPEKKIDDEIHPIRDVAASQQQVRLRMRALVEPFSGAIIESADQIMAATDDHSIRRAALVWKMEAVPALREALFRPNPYAAAVDCWVLMWQMADYFESGPGRDALGAAAPVAAQRCRELAGEIESVVTAMTYSKDVTDIRDFTRHWAGEHPIRYSIGGRESTLGRVTERELQDTFSTQEVAGDVLVTLDDLTRRMGVYSAQLPEQARWQAELAAMDLMAGQELMKAIPLAERAVQSAEDAVTILKKLEPAMEESLAVAKSAPQVISLERVSAIEAAQAEISRTLEFVRSERMATLEFIAREREAMVREMADRFRMERDAALAGADQIARNTVDHAVLRLAQLAAGVLVCLFVGAVLLLFLARRLLVVPRQPTRET